MTRDDAVKLAELLEKAELILEHHVSESFTEDRLRLYLKRAARKAWQLLGACERQLHKTDER